MKLLVGGRSIVSVRQFCLRSIARSSDKRGVIQLNDKGSAQRLEKTRQITFGSLCLLIVPVTTFVLGVWQVQRYKRRSSLIEELKREFPANSPDFPVEKLRVLEHKVNQNFAYYLTWFGLSFSTAAMWYTRFLLKRV